jgi:hypothetical protein
MSWRVIINFAKRWALTACLLAFGVFLAAYAPSTDAYTVALIGGAGGNGGAETNKQGGQAAVEIPLQNLSVAAKTNRWTGANISGLGLNGGNWRSDKRTEQPKFGCGNSNQYASSSQPGSLAPAIIFQPGGATSNEIISENRLSFLDRYNDTLLTAALDSMGARYGDTALSLNYQESTRFIPNAGRPFVIDLLDRSLLGRGVDRATFELSWNINLIDCQIFDDLIFSEASNNIFGALLVAGFNNLQLPFGGAVSGAGGSGANPDTLYPTPVPPSWTMMLIGLGFVAYRGMRKRAVATKQLTANHA